MVLIYRKNEPQYLYSNAINSGEQALDVLKKYINEVEGIPLYVLDVFTVEPMIDINGSTISWDVCFVIRNSLYEEMIIRGDVYSKDGSIWNIEQINKDEMYLD
jgi:hypothetical protein